MSLRWAESGGQYHFNTAPGSIAGLFGAGAGGNQTGTASPTNNGSTFMYGQNAALITPQLTVTGFTGGVIGYRCYLPTVANLTLMKFLDTANAEQCSLRTNAAGFPFFSRNGTNLGAGNPTIGSAALLANALNFIEFKVSLAISAAGSCEVVVNGVTVLTLASIQNATTVAKWFAAEFLTPNVGGFLCSDMYVCDTDSGTPNNNYLGDVTVAEIFDNAPGVNSAWSVGQASFVLTAAGNASGGVTTYTGTITHGATPTNAYQGYYFTVAGFATGGNNATGLCTASTATTISIQNAGGVAETHAGTCAFQSPLQQGIHGGIVDSYAITFNGTRPGVPGTSENQYIASNTVNQKSDFAHQALTLTGTIFGVIHRGYARKDDSGARSFALLCESGGTEEIGTTFPLTGSYVYYDDVLETDPHTGSAWTVTGFNNATFGAKMIS